MLAATSLSMHAARERPMHHPELSDEYRREQLGQRAGEFCLVSLSAHALFALKSRSTSIPLHPLAEHAASAEQADHVPLSHSSSWIISFVQLLQLDAGARSADLHVGLIEVLKPHALVGDFPHVQFGCRFETVV
jgi:hypothetical protein